MRKRIKRMMAVVLALSLLMPFADIGGSSSIVRGAENDIQTVAEVAGDDGSEGLTEIPELAVTSVDGKIKVRIWKDANNRYYWSAYRNNNVTMKCAPLGLITKKENLSVGLTLDEASIEKEQGEEDYDWLQGSCSHVSKQWQEVSFVLTKGDSEIKMIFRLFEDGVGYRYEVDGDTTSQEEVTEITSEESSFLLPDTANVWTMEVSATYEAANYTSRKMTSMKDNDSKYAPPILGKIPTGSSDTWILLAEANVYNEAEPYCACNFRTSRGSAAFKVNFGLRLNEEENDELDGKTYQASYSDIASITMKDQFHTPWRVAIMTDNLEDLTNSSLISDLNPEAEGDFSWVEPGTSSWSWWSTTSDAIDYDTMRDYIDYAEETGQKYCLIDFGWEVWKDYEEKIKELVAYADEKGVGILLWYGVNKFDHVHKFDLDNPEIIEQEFAWCESLGVKGVKVDYFNSDSQFAMKIMYDLASIAAEHKLIINYHGCTDPNGENRTFPNILSSEAVMGAEYFKWGSGSPVKSLLMLPYARNVIGSMEFTPVCMSVKNVKATDGFMLAMPVVYESAIQTLAHSAYVYPGYGGLSLLVDIPSTWDESRLLDGSAPGDAVIRARRSGETWYVGGMTNAANDYNVSLDFLDEGETYYAYIYTDKEDNSGIKMEKQTVTSATKLTIPLQKSSGFAIKISKSDTMKVTKYDNYNYFEAENAKLGRLTKISESSYVSRLKYVSAIKGNNGVVTFTDVEAPEAGLYDLDLYVVSPSSKKLYVKTNDYESVAVESIIGVKGDSNAVGRVSTQVYLDKGMNKIRLYNLTSSAPGIDRIAVSKTMAAKADAPAIVDDLPEEDVLPPEEGDNPPKDNTPDKPNTNVPGNSNGQTNNNQTTTKPTDGKTDDSSNPTTALKVAKVKGVKVKAGKKKLTVKFNKIKNAKGYVISYSTSGKFKKAKNLTLKASKVSKVIKKLKAKKTYYVRVRAFCMDGKKKKYGPWSAVKKAKTK